MPACPPGSCRPAFPPTAARPPGALPPAAADWSDIAGQQTAKDLIQEVVVWPVKNPQLFTVGWCRVGLGLRGSAGRPQAGQRSRCHMGAARGAPMAVCHGSVLPASVHACLLACLPASPPDPGPRPLRPAARSRARARPPRASCCLGPPAPARRCWERPSPPTSQPSSSPSQPPPWCPSGWGRGSAWCARCLRWPPTWRQLSSSSTKSTRCCRPARATVGDGAAYGAGGAACGGARP